MATGSLSRFFLGKFLQQSAFGRRVTRSVYVRDEIRALELAHEQASEEYREVVEKCKRMIEDANTLGDGNPDGLFIRNLAHALLRRATRHRTEASSRVTRAVLRSI